MTLLFIADGRSPITRKWISYFAKSTNTVHLISTQYIDNRDLPGIIVHNVWPRSGHAKSNRLGLKTKAVWYLRSLSGKGIFKLMWMNVFLPLSVLVLAVRARRIARMVAPDLTHALRIPVEGEVAGFLGVSLLVTSIWGNDFTLYAEKSIFHRLLTKKCLQKSIMVMADCQVDLCRSVRYGGHGAFWRHLVPGAGGIVLNELPAPLGSMRLDLTGTEVPMVINPRGFRRYVNNRSYFEALSILRRRGVRFRAISVDLEGYPEALAWVEEFDLVGSLTILGKITSAELFILFQEASISVSPSTHDGTPNSLLEAMYAGAFPICGRLPSIEEWIVDGRNGFLVDPSDPIALAAAIERALSDKSLRTAAAALNRRLVEQRADYDRNMAEVEMIYRQLIAEGGL
jgi:glycosyltransferase involved in cell wall biosynthesis